MTEHEDNRVHFLLDHLNVTGQVTLNEEDMLLILRHQRELGIEEGKRHPLADLAEHDKEIRENVLNEAISRISALREKEYDERDEAHNGGIDHAIIELERMKEGEE